VLEVANTIHCVRGKLREFSHINISIVSIWMSEVGKPCEHWWHNYEMVSVFVLNIYMRKFVPGNGSLLAVRPQLNHALQNAKNLQTRWRTFVASSWLSRSWLRFMAVRQNRTNHKRLKSAIARLCMYMYIVHQFTAAPFCCEVNSGFDAVVIREASIINYARAKCSNITKLVYGGGGDKLLEC
jgi:hypothetical protein